MEEKQGGELGGTVDGMCEEEDSHGDSIYIAASNSMRVVV